METLTGAIHICVFTTVFLTCWICLGQEKYYTKLQDGGQKVEYAQITTFSFLIFQNN